MVGVKGSFPGAWAYRTSVALWEPELRSSHHGATRGFFCVPAVLHPLTSENGACIKARQLNTNGNVHSNHAKKDRSISPQEGQTPLIVLVKLMSRGYGVVVSAISRESCHGTTNTSKHRGACRQETRDRLYFSLNYPEKCGHEKECLRP